MNVVDKIGYTQLEIFFYNHIQRTYNIDCCLLRCRMRVVDYLAIVTCLVQSSFLLHWSLPSYKGLEMFLISIVHL